MPLPRGYDQEGVTEKIRFLFRENERRPKKRSDKQIYAIALGAARLEAHRAGVEIPAHLRKKNGQHRHTR